MRLTRFTDYSLRILIYAATLEPGQLANVDDIAAIYGISANHVTKCVHLLGKLNFIHTIRGRNGGFHLAKPAAQIGVGEVIRLTEENWDTLECFQSDEGFCILNPSCRLKSILRQALDAYLAVLDQYTLEDICGNRALTRQLLGFGSPDSST